MSKLIKPEEYVEAHPCRLEPIDVDAFFVNEPEEVLELEIESQILETGEAEEEAAASGPETEEEIAASAEETDIDLSKFVDFAAKLSSLMDGNILEEPERPADSVQEEEPEPALRERVFQFGELPWAKKSDARKATGNSFVFEDELEDNDDLWTDWEANEPVNFHGNTRLNHAAQLNEAREQAETILDNARSEAENMIGNARDEAEKIVAAGKHEVVDLMAKAQKEKEELLAAARQEAEELKRKAREEGQQGGYQEGLAKARKELDQNLSVAQELITRAEADRIERLASSEPELLKLALGIAEKILGTEIQLNPAQQLEIVREALSKVTIAGSVTIRVHPEDLQLVEKHLPIVQEAFREPKLVKLSADPGMNRGSCFVETEHGNFDTRIKSQLEIIWNEIAKAAASGENPSEGA